MSMRPPIISQFHKIWLVNFEFATLPGAIPEIRCLVALDYHTGKKIRLWADEIEALAKPPYGIDQQTLIVAYYASAEVGCHLALGWNAPCHMLDLFTEFRNLSNGLTTPCGSSLQGALAYFGLSSAALVAQESMHQLVLRGGSYSSVEKQRLLAYCETEVDALARLLPVMLPHLKLPLSLLRGRYMKAAAHMEHQGIPIDTAQYGMGAEALAQRINQPLSRARALLALHRDTYRVFWHWSDSAVDYAMLHGKLWTVFGWTVHVDSAPNPRFLRNFTMQGNGAEMLRLACCLLTEAGIKVCAPVHDAILIEAPLETLELAIKQTQAIMAEASAIVLNGFRLNSETDVTRYPDRYKDERGQKMWQTVRGILETAALNQAAYCEGHA